MDDVSLFFIVLFSIVGCLLSIKAMVEDIESATPPMCGSMFLMMGVLAINGSTPSKYPQAIDVYRGKTTLERTYKDSVTVDSVVVFKKELRHE